VTASKTIHRLQADIAASGEAGSLPVERVQSMLPSQLLRDDEVIILLLRPSPLFIVLSSLAGLVAIIVVTLVLAYLGRSFPGIGWTDTQAFGLGLGLGALRLGWQSIDWWCRLYVLTDQRIIRRMGVLRVAVFETELRNIQHTSVFRRMREQVCGLGSIGFATAGSDVFEAFWVMLSQPFRVHRVIVETIERYGRS
jgi:hypothetical protein